MEELQITDMPGIRQRIALQAKRGDRILLDGKSIWKGLGNRSGLHGFADTLVSETWKKSGNRFLNKLKNISSGNIKIQHFYNINRDRGKWITYAKTVIRDR